MATIEEYGRFLSSNGYSREDGRDRILYLTGIDINGSGADLSQEVTDEALQAVTLAFDDDIVASDIAQAGREGESRRVREMYQTKPPTEQELEDVRRLMEGPPPEGGEQDGYTLRSLSAPGLPAVAHVSDRGAQGVQEIDIPLEESLEVMGQDPAIAEQESLRREEESQGKRRDVFRAQQRAADELNPPFVPPTPTGAGARRAVREMLGRSGRERAIEAREGGSAPGLALEREPTAGELADPLADPGVRTGLAYARGEAFPPKGMTPRDAAISEAKGESPRPDLRSDLTGQAGTVGSRIVWGLVGGGEAIGEDLVDAADAAERLHLNEVQRLAKEARANGEETFTVRAKLLTLAGGGAGMDQIRYKTDDVIIDDAKYAENEARIDSRKYVVLEALEEQREFMNKLLEDDPDFVSWYTARLWRDNVGELVNGLAQFVVYGSGAYPMSREETEARGFVENFFAGKMASKAFGAQIAGGVTAGFAKVFTDFEGTLQTEGPTVILDALAYGKALKAGALAAGRRLPPEVLATIDKIGNIAQPLLERMRSSKLGDAENWVLRNFGEHSQRNLSQASEELARDLIMESDTQRRIVDNVIQSQLIPLLEEGGIALGPRVEPVASVTGVRFGSRADGTPHTRDVDILPEEADFFEAEKTRVFNERMRQRGLSRRVDAEKTPVEMPSGIVGTEWRVAKDAKAYDLTPAQAAAWEEALEDAMPKLRAAKRKGKKGGKAFGRVMKKLRVDLEAIGEGKGKYRPMAPEVVEASERAGAEMDAAMAVANRRSPWGRSGDDPTAIETKLWTEDVTITSGKSPEVTIGSTLDTGAEQGRMATARKRINAGENADDVLSEISKEKGEGPYRTNELSGIPPQYRVTPNVILSDRAKDVVRRLADRVTGGGDDAVKFIGDLEANIARSIDDGLPEMLRSKTFRQEAAKRMTDIYVQRLGAEGKALSYRKRSKLQDDIERMIEEKQAPVVPESGKPGDIVPLNINFHVVNSDGKTVATINLLDEIAADVMKGDNGKLIMAESVAQTARRAAHRRAQKYAQGRFVEAMNEGADARWTKYNAGGILDKPTAFTETLRVIHDYLETGHMPAVIRNEPGEIRRNLSKLLQGNPIFGDVGIDRVMKIMGTEGIESLSEAGLMKKLKHVERRMQRYEDFSNKDPSKGFSAARRFLRVDDDLVSKARAQQEALGAKYADARRQVDIEPVGLEVIKRADDGSEVTSSVYVDRSMGRSIEGFAKAQEAVQEADFFMHGTTFLKSNMTARQLTTLKNNVLANVFLQGIRRGDPTQFAKTIKAGVEFKQWQLDPTSLSPRKRRIYDSISRTGKVETSFIDAEIAGLQSSGMIDRAFRNGWINSRDAEALGKLDKPGALMEDVYRNSDVFFKVEEGVYGFNKIEGALDRMDVGRMIELEVGANKRVSLRKLADGSYEVGTGRGRKFKKTGTLKAGSKLDDIIAKAAMRSGDKLFFDYFDVSGMARWARTSTLTTVVSPFYTWLSKAMDVPGVKKGLVSEMFSGGPYMWTDDAAIQMSRAADAARISASAHAAYAAAPGMYDRSDAREIREMLGWGHGMQARALGSMHKGVMQHYNVAQANSFSATDLVFRALESGYQAVMDVAQYLGGDDLFDEFSTQKEFLDAYKQNPDKVLSMGLEGVPESEANEIRARRKWLIKRGQQKTGITLADGLDLVGMAGNPVLEIWHMAAEAEAHGRDVSFEGKAYRFAGMLMGGTYAKAFDSMVGGVAPTSRLTTRFKSGDPLSGEEQDYFKWAIRNTTGIGWSTTNFAARDKKYHKALKQRWQKSLLEPINIRIKEFKRAAASKGLSAEERKEARGMEGNATMLKEQIAALITAEIDRSSDFYERINARYGNMLEKPKAPAKKDPKSRWVRHKAERPPAVEGYPEVVALFDEIEEVIGDDWVAPTEESYDHIVTIGEKLKGMGITGRQLRDYAKTRKRPKKFFPSKGLTPSEKQ